MLSAPAKEFKERSGVHTPVQGYLKVLEGLQTAIDRTCGSKKTPPRKDDNRNNLEKLSWESFGEIFIFTLLCGASKGFMKALKAFIKPFKVQQRSMKIKIYVNFYFNTTFWNERDGKG